MTSNLEWNVQKGQPFATTRVGSWSDFMNTIETHFLDWSEYFYRGHRDSSWTLRSKFDRWLHDANDLLGKFDPLEGLDAEDRAIVEQMSNPKSLGKRDALLRKQLARFKEACCGRRGPSPRQLSDDEWWALGRHVGLDTPLLDWSRSPYVACFFAMNESTTSSTGARSVWAYSHGAMQEILVNQAENIDKSDDDIESISLLDLPVDENTRSLSQIGLFTRTPDGEDIEDFVQNKVDLAGNSPVLIRIDIPELHREAFLRHLEAMNINSASLFPDLTGAAEYSNRGLEMEHSKIAWQLRPEFIRRLLSSDVSH